MAYWFTIGHLKSTSVKLKQILNGQVQIGITGETGYADGEHQHLGLIISDTQPSIKDFYSYWKCSDPQLLEDKYGKTSWNYLTLDFGALYGNYYTESNPHAGKDYGNNKANSQYKSMYSYSPPKAKSFVVDVGYDTSLGNYVMCKIIGNKEEEVKDFNRGKLNDWSVGGSSNINQVGLKISIDEKPDFIYLNNNGKQYSSYGDNFVEDVSYKNGVYSCKINTNKIPSGTYIIGTGKYDKKKDITTQGTKYDEYKVIENNNNLNLIIKENRAYVQITK